MVSNELFLLISYELCVEHSLSGFSDFYFFNFCGCWTRPLRLRTKQVFFLVSNWTSVFMLSFWRNTEDGGLVCVSLVGGVTHSRSTERLDSLERLVYS